MEVQLRRLGPDSKVKLLKIPRDCRTKIWLAGRGTSCQIYTKSKYASRQHFSIAYREQNFFISDLQSANGTFLNNEKLIGEKVLTFGSIISVGVPSEMQDLPDCIVYVFESNTDTLLPEVQPAIPKNNVQTVIESKTNFFCKTSYKQQIITDKKVDPQPKHPHEESVIKSALEKGFDIEKTILYDSSSSDIMIIEPTSAPKKHFLDSEKEQKSVKKRKFEENQEKVKFEEIKPQENNLDEDILAYEAMTQVDNSSVKTEPDLLNYSLTEELIEISDSEDDWIPNPRQEGNKSPEGGDEDDDVVFLQSIIKKPQKSDLSPFIKIKDDLTETDRKWMGKLLKIEKETEHSNQNEEMLEEGKVTVEEETDKVADEKSVILCCDKISRLSTQDEVHVSARKGVVPKKSVTFDMVPQIKYFEISSRRRLTASEKGRLRFTRVIFNICNWNTHWLEECKKVAPDKDPPDICEEPLRNIPKKFSNHSDYMLSFLPVMLLQLWNKIKDKWITTGETGFKQTVSCDSCENYHAENLLVYKCTGLVQSVSAHKPLIREGHLVLLRLHHIPLSDCKTPASEKYSKKLGYLVFGFVESKIYERFHNQPLHRSLAERCASTVGDLHVVRLNILVKKRPNFKLDKQKLIQLTVIQQISQEIRMFRGICFLPDSPLCASILKPTKIEAKSHEPLNKDLIFKGPFDDVQREIVEKLSYCCSTTNSLLYSIHGAAGTGKGQVIVALILQMLFGDEWKGNRPKIIYCTQWSIPLDEMVFRLKNYREIFRKPFSLVRVGPIREVKPEVRDLCVSNLVTALLNKRSENSKKFDPEVEIIKKADVICTTCISSGISKMCSAFERPLIQDRNRKVICIIDEAMSCKETNSVIPLLLGVTHLILVGDIYQMEHVSAGEKARALGLDMSLFWRIYKNFLNIPRELWPVHFLKTQYRMDSCLSEFTSQLIYNTPPSKPAARISTRIGSIRSHLLIVNRTPENIVIAGKENEDVRLVSQFVKTVSELTKGVSKNVFSFAVITCESSRVESLQLLLPKTMYPEVEIGLIQAFQGREFDVVFFYAERKVLNSWIATALTRARCGLFIVTSEQSIKENAFLQRISEVAEKYNLLKYVHSDMSSRELKDIIKEL